MFKCQNKTWIENIMELFNDNKIIPLGYLSFESKINSLTRLILLCFIIVLIIFDVKKSLIFLSISLSVIILFYYIFKNKKNIDSKESYMYQNNNYSMGKNGFASNHRGIVNKNNDLIMERPTAFRFCNDEVPFKFNDEKYISINQKLVGPPNPKTLIPPVIVPPSHDLSYWKANNLITHSHVNEKLQIDNYQSGYQVSTCCGNTDNIDTMSIEQFLDKDKSYQTTNPQINKSRSNYKGILYDKSYLYGDSQSKNNLNYNYSTNKFFQKENDLKENYIEPVSEIKPLQSGQVNISCGYNPDNIGVGLQSNYPTGNCEKDPIFSEYNRNLRTQYVQPGVYDVNQINEPINSNMGISFNQQFEPLSVKTYNNGDVLYTEHDPRLVEEIIEPVEENVNESNVYDPRFSGYGTSYRSYTDDLLGNTKFFYDDINAVRMPNYITRSKVDFLPLADTYGAMKNANGNENNSIIRNLVNDAWTRNSLEFRSGLQQSLMRKRNAELWQTRQFPKSTMNQRMLS